MDKEWGVAELIRQLELQYQRTAEALRLATEGATGDDTRAENKYDTRSLESSYLASGLAGQVDRLARDLARVKSFSFPALSDTSSITIGAFVEADLESSIVYYLLAPAGGGIVIEHKGQTITVLAPAAPLAANLLDKKVGDRIDHPPLVIRKVC